MDIRILALDLDGTLLTNHNSVSETCRNAVQLARKKGVQAVICTGRNAADSCMFAEQAGGMDWAITANGAEIRSLQDPSITIAEPLGEHLCQTLVSLCSGFEGADPCFYTADAVYYGASFEQFIRDCAAHGHQFNFSERNHYHRIPDCSWDAFIRAHRGSILKAILHASDPSVVDRMHEAVAADGRFETAPSEMFGGALKNIEVNRRGVTKGRALATLAARLGCSMSHVMAVGDSDNDLSMIRMAGLGVAMGNAPAHIRAAANAVTDDNRVDGAARAIERWLL